MKREGAFWGKHHLSRHGVVEDDKKVDPKIAFSVPQASDLEDSTAECGVWYAEFPNYYQMRRKNYTLALGGYKRSDMKKSD